MVDQPANMYSLSGLKGLFRRSLGKETMPEMTELDRQADALFSLKARLLVQMREQAQEKGLKPSIELYRQIQEEFQKTDEGKALVAEGKFNDRIAADLSGQDLSGVVLSEPKRVYNVKNQIPQVQADYDSFDRDGDGKINLSSINPFYDNVKLDGASLRDAIVDPATSFNDQIKNAADRDGLTLNDLKADDKFVFAPGQYTNIKMTNVFDGELEFAAHSHVDGLLIEGRTAKVTLGTDALVEHVKTNDEFRFLQLHMGKNSILADSDLSNVIGIDMNSKFEPGAKFQNVTLGGHLEGVGFEGLRMNNVIFNKVVVDRETSFKGATLQNVTFAEVNIADMNTDGIVSMSGKLVVGGKEQAIHSLDDFKRMQKEARAMREVADAGKALLGQMDLLKNPTAITSPPQTAGVDTRTPDAQLATAPQEPAGILTPTALTVAEGQKFVEQMLAATGITGGASVNPDQVRLSDNHAVAEMKRPAQAPDKGDEGGWVRSLNNRNA